MSMKSWSVVGAMLGVGALVLGACSTGTTGRGAELVTCTAGTQVDVACGGIIGVGSCAGDPILTVCDGATIAAINCVDSSSIGYINRNDDRIGFCPGLTVTCPASGSIAVRPSAFSGVPTCNWETRTSGI